MEVRVDRRKVRRSADHTGKKINRLTFLKYVEKSKCGNARWLVRCDCGVEFVVDSRCVMRGATKSCGCLRTEANKRRRRRQNTRVRLLDYAGREYWVDIPENTEYIEGEIISGDMVLKSPIEFDTGDGARWVNYYDGSFKVPIKNLEWFNSIESYYELLKRMGI